MRAASLGIVLGSTSIAAGATSLITSVPSQVLSGSGCAILGWALWYLLTKTFPAHTEALRASQDAFLAAQKQERREFRRSLRMLARAIRKRRRGRR